MYIIYIEHYSVALVYEDQFFPLTQACLADIARLYQIEIRAYREQFDPRSRPGITLIISTVLTLSGTSEYVAHT